MDNYTFKETMKDFSRGLENSLDYRTLDIVNAINSITTELQNIIAELKQLNEKLNELDKMHITLHIKEKEIANEVYSNKSKLSGR